VAILNPGEVAAEQPGPFFNVTLRHSPLQPEIPDCYPNIHLKVSVHGNQSSTRWQAKSYNIGSNSVVLISLSPTIIARKRSNGFTQAKFFAIYFFSVLAKKLTVFFHASCASFGR
jgi:hypothetical protein